MAKPNFHIDCSGLAIRMGNDPAATDGDSRLPESHLYCSGLFQLRI